MASVERVTSIDKSIEDFEDRIEALMDERVEAEAQLEAHELVWTKVGVRFWSFDMFIPRINA